jgi:Lanthionine synthetase C-like protein/HopA1 effector protein family
MNRYRAQLDDVISAVRYGTPDELYWFGQPVNKVPPSLKRRIGKKSEENVRRSILQSLLYQNFYCMGCATPPKQESTQAGHFAVQQEYVERLRAANAGRGHADLGWTTVGEFAQIDSTSVMRKGGLLVVAKADQYRILSSDAESTDRRLLMPKDLRGISPGFYTAVSDEPLLADASIFRVYWNLTPAAAVKLMRIATEDLNRRGIRFRLKVLSDPGRYTRRDAGVLYLDAGEVDNVDVIDLYRRVSADMKPGGPALTLELAPGLAFAEDPANGESFGMHRCGLIADGLLVSAQKGNAKDDETFAAVESAFAAKSITLDAPYSSCAPSLMQRVSVPSVSHVSRALKPPPADRERWRELADSIAGELVRSAYRHGRYCTWMSHVPNQMAHRGVELVYRSLGSTIYDGVAGVAFFLAEYARESGTAQHRDLAIAAVLQSLRVCEQMNAKQRLGLYTGCVGVALVAAYIGMLLDAPRLISEAANLARRTRKKNAGAEATDMLTGSAGAIAGLVILADLLNDRTFIDWAIELADDLLKGAKEDKAGGLAWPTKARRGVESLLGFSHGASGVAFALNELSAATAMTTYRNAASRAALFERSWFRAEEGNWPDLRDVASKAVTRAGRLPMAVYWCHGAPGIAGARLRAAALFDDATEFDEAACGVRTTSAAIAATIQDGGGGDSLCHGTSGNLDILLYAAQTHPNEFAGCLSSVLDETLYKLSGTIVDHAASPRGKACDSINVGLFLGMTGIGLLALRMCNDVTPSVLVPNRDSFRTAIESRN